MDEAFAFFARSVKAGQPGAAVLTGDAAIRGGPEANVVRGESFTDSARGHRAGFGQRGEVALKDCGIRSKNWREVHKAFVPNPPASVKTKKRPFCLSLGTSSAGTGTTLHG